MTSEKIADSQKVAGGVATFALLVSLIVGFWGWGTPLLNAKGHWNPIKIVEAVILLCWTVLPPMWFWYEYHWLFPKTSEYAAPDGLEKFKYAQDLASKIWIGAASALLMLYFLKDLKGQ